MPAFINLTGQTFHRLTVVHRVKMAGTMWLCRCECGNETIVGTGNLRKGMTKSCGCWRRAFPRVNKTHGKGGTKLFAAWCSIRNRCYNKNVQSYPLYGGRGIKVCKQWRKSFITFAEHVGEPPSIKHSIERIDNNGHYEPGNVRWATKEEQANNKRNNHVLTFNGKSQTIAQWSKVTGFPSYVIWFRIARQDWPVKKALTQKPRKLPSKYSNI